MTLGEIRIELTPKAHFIRVGRTLRVQDTCNRVSLRTDAKTF